LYVYLGNAGFASIIGSFNTLKYPPTPPFA